MNPKLTTSQARLLRGVATGDIAVGPGAIAQRQPTGTPAALTWVAAECGCEFAGRHGRSAGCQVISRDGHGLATWTGVEVGRHMDRARRALDEAAGLSRFLVV